ncbi:MAG: 50S ribosomal protein L27 [Candidatus Paceibacterota bacterium]|jgi:large subunit ribosomal protein L27
MAHRKAGGTASNLNDSKPKYLGIKLSDGEKAGVGSVLVRQRGTKIMPGKNVGTGKDHTLFALKPGMVKYASKRKVGFDGKTVIKKIVNVQ